jgi:hypothetical protein
MEYLPWTTFVNCTAPAISDPDPPRYTYACVPSTQLESTVVHLVYITSMMFLTAIVYVIYRQYHTSRAERRLLCSAVLASDAATKSRVSSALASAKCVPPAMLRKAL